MQENDLARYIDHTLLTATATAADIIRLCRESVAYNFYAVCVHSRWLPLCRAQLAGTPVKLAAVIDFPHGAGLSSARTHAAAAAVAAGAGELDVVVPLPLVMEKDWRGITEDTRNLVEAAGRSEEHTSELQSRENLVCRLLLEKKKRTATPDGNRTA